MALPLHSSPLIFHTLVSAEIPHLLKIEFKALAAFRSSLFQGNALTLKLETNQLKKKKLIDLYIIGNKSKYRSEVQNPA